MAGQFGQLEGNLARQLKVASEAAKQTVAAIDAMINESKEPRQVTLVQWQDAAPVAQQLSQFPWIKFISHTEFPKPKRRDGFFWEPRPVEYGGGFNRMMKRRLATGTDQVSIPLGRLATLRELERNPVSDFEIETGIWGERTILPLEDRRNTLRHVEQKINVAQDLLSEYLQPKKEQMRPYYMGAPAPATSRLSHLLVPAPWYYLY